ncbi:MAG: ATP-binding protein [Thermodesulfobacteriota bacterium]|nr:ATP-binding protein [Thermodesulfobacteriota bacterium]
MIYSTGGIDSVFNFFYILSIVSASIFLGRRGSFIIASEASILYGISANLEYYNIIRPKEGQVALDASSQSSTDILYLVIMNLLAFYLVAFLSSYLAVQLSTSQKALQKKQIDFDYLRALHNDIVQSVNTGILTVDKNFRITSFNKAAEEITGFMLNQVYYSDLGEVFPELEKIIAQNSLINNVNRYEIEHKKKGGEILYLGFSFSPLRDNLNNNLGMIIIFQNLTKLKEMEDQIKRSDRLATVGRLAAGLAHEIRNPLASMSGSIQILKNDPEISTLNKSLMDIVIRETERLDRLINEFLLFAYPGKRKTEKIDLISLLLDTLQTLKNDPLWNNDVVVVKSLQHNLFLEGDEYQLKQVFLNIFINALQALPGRGQIKILSEYTHDKEFIKITITDNGSGIAEENIKKIFDPFYTTKEKGVGLGLSIVHRIVENHRGQINVKSKASEETSFTIYLPEHQK